MIGTNRARIITLIYYNNDKIFFPTILLFIINRVGNSTIDSVEIGHI